MRQRGWRAGHTAVTLKPCPYLCYPYGIRARARPAASDIGRQDVYLVAVTITHSLASRGSSVRGKDHSPLPGGGTNTSTAPMPKAACKNGKHWGGG